MARQPQTRDQTGPDVTPGQISPQAPVRARLSLRGRLVVVALVLAGLAAGSITAWYWKYIVKVDDTAEVAAPDAATDPAAAPGEAAPPTAPPATDPRKNPAESTP